VFLWALLCDLGEGCGVYGIEQGARGRQRAAGLQTGQGRGEDTREEAYNLLTTSLQLACNFFATSQAVGCCLGGGQVLRGGEFRRRKVEVRRKAETRKPKRERGWMTDAEYSVMLAGSDDSDQIVDGRVQRVRGRF
jgi:hypothetical protein